MAAEILIPVDPRAMPVLRAGGDKLRALVAANASFRAFLDHWRFVDQETGRIRVLGESLWPGQERFVEAVSGEPRVMGLKARKLGWTTIECAWDGYVARFGSANARVHLFSRRDDAAQKLLGAVEHGLKRLPDYMRLPTEKDTTHELHLRAGPDDLRTIQAYPADDNTAVESTCNHAHVDEWGRMGNPRRVWASIEPSVAGSCHIITTGMGPANYSSTFWRRAMAGDSAFVPVFVDALQRPDRSREWLEAKAREMGGGDAIEFRREYAMTWQDALYGGGEFVFDFAALDRAGEDTPGPSPAVPGHRYVKAWDVGRHKDAAVGIVLDVTGDVHDVVEYVRLRGVRYPDLQRTMEGTHTAYPGLTVVEKNAAGEAVLENLDIPEHETDGFVTTKPSKARIIKGLEVGFQNETIRYDQVAWSQLDVELRGYQVPDDAIVQDSVMALAIAEEFADRTVAVGKAGRILAW